MITFSKNPVNRRDPSDEPSPEPFYIIYEDGSDVGELYADIAAGTAEAFISQGAAHLVMPVKDAVRKYFKGITTTEVLPVA